MMCVRKSVEDVDKYYHDAMKAVQDASGYSEKDKQLLGEAISEKRATVIKERADAAETASAPTPSIPATSIADKTVGQGVVQGRQGGFASFMGYACIVLGVIGALILAFTFGRDRYGDINFVSFIAILLGSSFGSLLIGSIAIGVGDIQRRLTKLENMQERK